jgi:hypothetical protein
MAIPSVDAYQQQHRTPARDRLPEELLMTPANLAKLVKRHDPRPTECGMRVTPAYFCWREVPRKWVSLTTWHGGYFVVEDK